MSKCIIALQKACMTAAVVTACVMSLAGTSVAVDYEAESWNINSSYPTAAKLTGQSGASGSSLVAFSSAPTSAGYYFIEMTTPTLTAGTYSLSYLYKSTSSQGKVQVSVDGVNIGTVGDQYSAGQVQQVNMNVGNVTLGFNGPHQIRFTTNSKNASSSGYAITIDRISMTPAGGTTYTLTTSATNGTVTKSPNAASYPANTVVTLTATPATGYVFSGWSGSASGTLNPLSVTVTSNMSIVANFTAAPTSYLLTTSTTGSGTISRSPDNTTYPAGTIVTLTATPATGYQFVSWSGDIAGTSHPATILMDNNHHIIANFELIPTYQAGDMQYFNGTAWTRIPKGEPGQVLTQNATQVPVWVNNGTWIDYSSECITEGWSEIIYKVIRYSVVGKTVHVSYSVNGTSNSTTCSISLPFKLADVRWNSDNLCVITMEGMIGPGRCHINNSMGNQQITIFPLNEYEGQWLPYSQKSISGEITYEIE